MVKAKTAIETATRFPPNGPRMASNALAARIAPGTLLSMGIAINITRAVIVQITIVSMNVPSIATIPCSTGLSVFAAA